MFMNVESTIPSYQGNYVMIITQMSEKYKACALMITRT